MGAVVLVGAGAWLGARGAERAPVQLAALASGGLAVLGAALARRRPGWAAVAAGGAGLVGATAASWAYEVVSFPHVDLVRPWGMDWSPTPLLRPTPGLFLLLLVVGRAFGPPGRGRVLARALGVGACAYVVGWWLVPRWYEMDLIAREGIVPDLPSFLPQPGRVGEGDTPAVLGGRLVHLNWTQYAFQMEPLRAAWYVAHRELAVAALAHGLHREIAQAKVAAGSLAPDVAAAHATVRAALWSVQRGASVAWLYAQAAALPLLAATALRLLWGRPGPRWATVTRWVLLLLLAAGPVVNLALLAGGALAGLPDVRSGALRVVLESLGLLAAVCAVDLGAAAFARVGAPASGAAVGAPPAGAEEVA